MWSFSCVQWFVNDSWATKNPSATGRERFDNSDMRLLPLHKKKESASNVHWLTLYRQFDDVASKTLR